MYLYLVYSAYLYAYLCVSAWTSLTTPIPRVFSRQRKQGRKCKYFALRTCSRRACTHPSVCQSARVSEALSLTAWSLAIRSSAWQHPWRFFFSAANWILLALSSTVYTRLYLSLSFIFSSSVSISLRPFGVYLYCLFCMPIACFPNRFALLGSSFLLCNPIIDFNMG